jgi:anti-anti-sigma regulatory factor
MNTASSAGPARAADLRPGIPLLAAAPGPLDVAAAEQLGDVLDETLDRHPWGVVLDLSGVDEMSPAGVEMLVRVAVRAGRLDVGLCPVPSDAVLAAIAGAGSRELFDLHACIDEALAALGVAPGAPARATPA